MTIGENIRRLRKARGMSQAKLGIEVDTYPHRIHEWEVEKHFPSLMNAVSLADYFGITLDELVRGEGNE